MKTILLLFYTSSLAQTHTGTFVADNTESNLLTVINFPIGEYMRKILILILSLFSLAQAAEVYVGVVEGSDALVAIVIDENQILAYSCGGTESWQTHTSWFSSQAEGAVVGNTSFTLVGRSGLQLRGIYTDSEILGTLKLKDGTLLSWVATPVAENSPAGLYKLNEITQEREELTGLIVGHDLQSNGTIRIILPKVSTTRSEPVRLDQELPGGMPNSLQVCALVDDETLCKELPRATSATL
jgi:hypothetical protein